MKKIAVVLMAFIAGLAAAAGVVAQEEELTLHMSRDWGYGGLNGDIQGTFTLKAGGPADLARVEFYIDDLKIGEVASTPFNLQFVTDNYPAGAHSLRAVGYTSDGRELGSPAIAATFLSRTASNKALVTILAPVLGIVGVLLLLGLGASLLAGRQLKTLPPGTPRRYPLGGAICPKCARPVALQLYGLNVMVGKLQRCPYCGRWSALRRAPLEMLRAAEQAELAAAAHQVPAASAEERFRKDLEDSKYQ